MTFASERRPDSLRVVHGLLFAVAVVAAVVDVGSSSGFGIPILGPALSVPLVGLALGVANLTTQRPGGRTILGFADIAVMVAAAASASASLAGPFGSPGLVVPTAILGALAAVGLLVALRTRPTSVRPEPPRTVGHRVAGAAIFGFAVITLIAPYLTVGRPFAATMVLTQVPWLAGVGLALAAWWYGSGWLLALFGVGSLAASLNVALALTALPFDNHVVLGIGAVVMGLRPPRSASRGPGPSIDARPEDVPVPERRRRPISAAIWTVLGAILFVPTVLFGRWVPGFIDCFDLCPPISPLAEPTAQFTLLAVVFVPLAAIAVALEPRSRPGATTWISLVGLLGVAVVLGQVALGLSGIEPFTFVSFGAPAAVLTGTGFVSALASPRWLARTGRVAAVGSAIAGLIWMATGLDAGGGFIDLPLVGAAGLVTGAVVIVALGRAFGAGPVAPPAPPDRGVHLTSAAASES